MINFPCLICQCVYDGRFLWNIHGNSISEDRHLLCTPCLIKYSKPNAVCPLRCGDPFAPLQLNPGYRSLITKANSDFVSNNPTDTSVPTDSCVEQQELWLKLVTNVDSYITLDHHPVVYGWGKFRQLTYFMSTLKTESVHDNIKDIFALKSESLSNLDIRVGAKRKADEMTQRLSISNEITIDINDILERLREQEE